MTDDKSMKPISDLRHRIRSLYLADEQAVLDDLVAAAGLTAAEREKIAANAADYVRRVRASAQPQMMEVFLSEYGLSTGEGVALMCLAEALLRVPDAETIDDLIRDKIAPHDWSAHAGHSNSIFVNASTWALMLTGKVLDEGDPGIERTLRGMVRRLGEPVIRRAVAAAMREMGEQFVLGRTIGEAVRRGRDEAAKGYLFSYDMLGEAARTHEDALRYHTAYATAINALAKEARDDDTRRNPGISVKLSALHPRYERLQRETMMPVLCERLRELAVAARRAGMGLNVDAEEADRLDISLDVIEEVLATPELAGWDGFGVVVQAYSKRCAAVIDWLHELAGRLDRRIMVRLVKGAYWDTEIKRAQVMGLAGYPVFTRKANTDIAYIASARKLLSMTDRLYPQFATHNAHTVAAILAMADDREAFEFQRLHGMGAALHEEVRIREGTRCRIYAPVGAHADLLAYLVRRLLENGANSSFVHQIVDDAVPAEEVARDPFVQVARQGPAHNSAIALPADIYGRARRNAHGWDMTDPLTQRAVEQGRSPFAAPHRWTAGEGEGPVQEVRNPANPDDVVGHVRWPEKGEVAAAAARAEEAFPAWAARPVLERAGLLRAVADLYEANAEEFFALAAREAGKTIGDGIAEVREAVDFLRYYAAGAAEAEKEGAARGVIACISPWNFPLAIFTGQVAAALAAGNTVLAKPAEQTPLIAARAVALMHEAGIPRDVLQLLPGDGGTGAALVADPRLAGVCFTGSTDTARAIERQLAETAAPDAMLIAETGGLNAMIVDSTALAEQAVRDIVASAFQSAGQRCSALRMLYVQRDVEPHLMAMLKGAMEALQLGDPWQLATDVGPVIDEEAHSAISGYCRAMEADGRLIAKLAAPAEGRFVAPHIFRLDGIEDLEREIFGPVLHVATFEAEEIDRVLAAINARDYGLTFGLHTRIDARVQHVVDRIHVGNIYVNRNQIGAVVGSQPFGGEGLSGTGPKAGGPHYLRRFRKPADASDAAAPAKAEPMPPQRIREHFPVFDERGWAAKADRIAVLRRHLRGKASAALAAAAALDHGPVDLPGPTGEDNTLMLAARGRVLCLAEEPDRLLAHAVQALAAGNGVLAVAPEATAALKPLLGKGLPLAALDGALDPAFLETLPLDVVAYAGPAEEAGRIRRALASRTGPIVRLVTAAIDPVAFCHERSICVDTTAAGGNASLLAATQ